MSRSTLIGPSILHPTLQLWLLDLVTQATAASSLAALAIKLVSSSSAMHFGKRATNDKCGMEVRWNWLSLQPTVLPVCCGIGQLMLRPFMRWQQQIQQMPSAGAPQGLRLLTVHCLNLRLNLLSCLPYRPQWLQHRTRKPAG